MPSARNAILVCHALTGDQHVANVHPVTGKPGWWETMVGPGKPIDTDRYFVICSNVIGGCMGSTGPASTNPATGKPWGLDFPVITIRDMVRAQAMLIDHLGIDTLFSRRRRLDGRHAGAAMGGELSASACSAALPIACATRHSAQNIAFHEVGRQAVMADPEWRAWPLSVEGHQSASRPRGRAHGRAHHLSVGRRAASQVRPQVAGPRQCRRSRSTRISRSKAICAIRARPSSSASTPIPISI